jgi:ABC-type nickel/cobalt efflux system permease component RcnA
MDALSWNLLATAAALGVIHTIAGPDHWVPFIVLGRARGWSRPRTLAVTLACGVGHVGSSVVLGFLTLWLGWEATRLAGIEAVRGDLAAWGLVAFGAAYGLWGVRRALRGRTAIEPHEHAGGTHIHAHGADRHEHDAVEHARLVRRQTTFWSLFVIFVLGPCEPMIPLFVLPLARGDMGLAAITAGVFSAATLLTMAVAVLLVLAGVERIRFGGLERWSHAVAGAAVAFCGFAILFLGL